jgi:hypothetical protein
MAEEFDSGPTFIERSLSAPSMSVYDSFQDFLPTNLPSRLNSKYNSATTSTPASSTTKAVSGVTSSTTTTASSSSSSSHYNVTTDSNNDESSYLAALTDLDILDDSHVAQIKSLVIDPKAKTFDYIPVGSSSSFFLSFTHSLHLRTNIAPHLLSSLVTKQILLCSNQMKLMN